MNWRASRVGGCLAVHVERRADGTQLLRSAEALGEHPQRVTDRLEHWARVAPDRTFVARRDPSVPGGGDWIRISYAQMLERARRVGQALLERRLSAERPVAILSDNDLEHLTLALGALWAGIPFVPVSPAYSLVSQDFGKLRHILDRVTPGLVFASGPAYAKAIATVTDEQLTQPWSILHAGTPFFTLSRATRIRSFVLNHLIHHRAILYVYLRLIDIPVAGMYDPSGDD